MQQTLMRALALANVSHLGIVMMMNNELNDIDIACCCCCRELRVRIK
jgi:NADH:ubiquinone oxidoreductase subunit 4 (subunit M)